MAEDPLESIRLTFMQEFLPVGLAMVERVRKGGPGKVAEAFNESTDPFDSLKKEGDSAARYLRDYLDQIHPGLGNPVMEVRVDIANDFDKEPDLEEQKALENALQRIEGRLDSFRKQLDHSSCDSSNTLNQSD